MDAHRTEDEQIESIKKWWKENGNTLLFSAAIVLFAVGGWRYWQGQQQAAAVQASTLFDNAVQGLASDNQQLVSDSAGQVVSEFSKTGYAPLSALTLAKAKHEAGDYAAAQTYLQWALDNTKDESLKHVARVRLAAALWEQDKADEALRMLEGVDQGKFVASYEDLRGDILGSQGKFDQAIQAYQLALGDETFADRENVQLKIDALKSKVAK